MNVANLHDPGPDGTHPAPTGADAGSAGCAESGDAPDRTHMGSLRE